MSGHFFPGYFVDKYGRKWSIIGNAFLFTFGALVRFNHLNISALTCQSKFLQRSGIFYVSEWINKSVLLWQVIWTLLNENKIRWLNKIAEKSPIRLFPSSCETTLAKNWSTCIRVLCILLQLLAHNRNIFAYYQKDAGYFFRWLVFRQIRELPLFLGHYKKPLIFKCRCTKEPSLSLLNLYFVVHLPKLQWIRLSRIEK